MKYLFKFEIRITSTCQTQTLRSHAHAQHLVLFRFTTLGSSNEVERFIAQIIIDEAL